MNFSEYFIQAIDGIKSNKLRSMLTMLGIVMGVFSIITIVAIGSAAQAYMSGQFEKLGANVITITPSTKTVNENDWLTLEDIDIIKNAVPEIRNIHAGTQVLSEIRVGNSVRDALVYGATSQSIYFWTNEMIEGRFLNNIDVSTKANVIVVNENFAERHFKNKDAVGKTIALRNFANEMVNYTIVGVCEGDMFESIFGENYPATVYIPITTYMSFYNVKKLDYIEVSVIEEKNLSEIGMKIVKALEFSKGNKNMYRATNSADLEKTMSDLMRILSMVLLVIAIITLVVGGIGIVNILLVSVTERIREIGVRKAIGARKKDIVLQFLTESIIMTGISGLIGIFLGVAIGAVISSIIKLPPIVNIEVILLSFLGSIVLGIIFGVYPAKKAADLEPTECLRYE